MENKCPTNIKALEDLEKMIPMCRKELLKQVEARVGSGAAKSVREASKQIADETGRSPESIRSAVKRQKKKPKDEVGAVHPLNGSKRPTNGSKRPTIDPKVEKVLEMINPTDLLDIVSKADTIGRDTLGELDAYTVLFSALQEQFIDKL